MRETFVIRKSFLECKEVMTDIQYAQYLNALCDYGFEGKEPVCEDKLVMAFFNTNKKLIDASNNRYDRCIEQGKYGVLGKEFGAKGGRPRKGETREEYLERKKKETPINPLKGNNEKPLKNPLDDDVDDDLDVDDDVDVDLDVDDDVDVDLKENNSQYINTLLPKENNLEEIEKIFRNKLREGDNRKWVTEYKTFYDLTQNFEFNRWIISLPEEVSDNLSSIWYKFKKTFVSRNS